MINNVQLVMDLNNFQILNGWLYTFCSTHQCIPEDESKENDSFTFSIVS